MMKRKTIFTRSDTHGETIEDKPNQTERVSSVEKQSKTKQDAVSIRSLFQYGTSLELFYLFIGLIASAVYGISFPLALLVFGDAINSYIEGTTHLCSLNLTALSEKYCPSNVLITPGNFYTTMPLCHFNGTNLMNINFSLKDAIRKPLHMSIIIGCVSLLSAYIRVTFSNISAEKQVRRIRKKFFQSILEKDVAFFDQHQTGQLTLHLTDNINKIGKGMGEKLTAATEMLATFISCFVIGFTRGWKLSLVIVAVAPLIFIPIIVLFALIKKMTAIELEAYGKAGVIAEEVISSIRTVLSYNGQQKEIHRYQKHLDKARILGIKKSFIGGIRMSITYFLIFSIYALGFWYGTKLVWEDNYSIGVVFTVFITINFGMVYLAEASPHFQAFYDARVAAFAVWKIISSPVTIDKNTGLDSSRHTFIGHIQFSNVYFSYPSRSDVPILTNLSFDVQPGQTIALVGPSGSGKSTCIQLLQRFYDPHFGSISVDQRNIAQYNLSWLRERIAVVSQEPVLFHGTIRENILFGCDSAKDEQIVQAAQMANAHDFIMMLPNKYETEVGERGVALSGGQKQRIAIARALLPNPQILLLDEATSALDSESEKLVQEALNRAAQGRTTIVVAHRLSTIRHADRIIVMEKGGIVEQGDHKTLMKTKGAYFNLVQQQILHQIEQSEGLAPKHRQKKKKKISSNEEKHHHHDPVPPSDELHLEKPIELVSDSMAIEISNEKHKEKKRNVTLAILRMNKPEWISLTIGLLVSCLSGAREPGYLLIQAKLAIIFQECDVHIQKQRVPVYIFLYIGLAVMSLILHSIQGYAFGRSGEALTKRLRSKAFQSILRQDVSYFDEKEHSTGALCTRLATEASAVQGASGVRMGLIIQYFCSMIIGLIIGFVYSWQLTFLMLAFLPFMLFGGILQVQLASRFANKDKSMVEDAGQVTLESIENIRTVFQLTKETHFFDQYSRILDQIYQSSLKRIHIMSVVYAVSNSMFYFSLAAFISLSTYLIENGRITFPNGFMVLNCVVLTARAIGRALNLFPDYGEALAAAENIFQLLDRQPTIDNQLNDGNQIENFSGELHFDGVYFAYPNRSKSTILRNFQLHIKSGQRVALVGASGCGKSTIIQLIERFYDVDAGRLLIDSQDIRKVDLHWYRSQIGIVSQEPVLFDVSIRENIAYGDNNREDISMDEIIRAAKDANIDHFIQSLPQGYETICGAKGVQLSGGQKQRIAIARALIGNPKILLLDEATSALDSENEQLVQEALDRAQQNRTSITFAHRLTTIQNADIIYVLHHGMIVESGNHEELMKLHGRYYRLVQQKLK